jgi:hypothetical protein
VWSHGRSSVPAWSRARHPDDGGYTMAGMSTGSDAPAPPLSAEDVLRALAEDAPGAYVEALASADAHREALVGPLLAALERGIADPMGASKEDASTFSYALYLLAKWREPRAYPYVVRWLSLPEEEPFDIAGDIVTQDGARILAAVFDGNTEPIHALILNRLADQYGRSAGVTALSLLAAWDGLPRAQVVDHFLWLVREGLEREPNAAWDSLASNSVDIEALELFPSLRSAHDEGLIDPRYVSLSEFDTVETMARGEMLRKTRERHPPIDDVAAAIAWWDRRAPDSAVDGDRPDEDDRCPRFGEYVEVSEPYRAPPKIGRNEPCPCGSGKKYKKCCGR